MIKKITNHFSHYVSLIGVFIVGIMGMYYFRSDSGFQIAISLAMCVSYLAWGITHHLVHKDLYFETVLEYLAFSILGFIIIYSLILSL